MTTMKKADKVFSRRKVLKFGAAGVVAASATSIFPSPSIARTTKLEYTLAWLPTGQYAFVSLAKKALLKKHGIAMDVKRGYGSLGATQAIASGRQFKIGSASTAGSLLGISRGLALQMVCTHGYDSSMGILVPVKSDIKEPKDLEGKSIGVTAAGGDTPFLSAYYELVGVDRSTIKMVSLDAQVIEQAVINGQVDCMVAFGMSSIPKFMARDYPVKLFPFSSVGLRFSWINTLVYPDFLESDGSLVRDVVGELIEAQKFAMLNPDQAVEAHLDEHPEIRITDNGKLFTELGVGMVNAAMISDVAVQHGLGFQDKASIAHQGKLVHKYLGKEGDIALFKVDSYCTNDYLKTITLTDQEWDAAKANAKKYADMLGITF